MRRGAAGGPRPFFVKILKFALDSRRAICYIKHIEGKPGAKLQGLPPAGWQPAAGGMGRLRMVISGALRLGATLFLSGIRKETALTTGRGQAMGTGK